MAKRFKRNRKPLQIDEVSELPYKDFEEKMKKLGITRGIVRIRKLKTNKQWK